MKHIAILNFLIYVNIVHIEQTKTSPELVSKKKHKKLHKLSVLHLIGYMMCKSSGGWRVIGSGEVIGGCRLQGGQRSSYLVKLFINMRVNKTTC